MKFVKCASNTFDMQCDHREISQVESKTKWKQTKMVGGTSDSLIEETIQIISFSKSGHIISDKN
jgi:hypothetical protein